MTLNVAFFVSRMKNMTKWHGGKGSKRRDMQIEQEQFDKNFEAIFGKKKRRNKDASKTKSKPKDKR